MEKSYGGITEEQHKRDVEFVEYLRNVFTIVKIAPWPIPVEVGPISVRPDRKFYLKLKTQYGDVLLSHQGVTYATDELKELLHPIWSANNIEQPKKIPFEGLPPPPNTVESINVGNIYGLSWSLHTLPATHNAGMERMYLSCEGVHTRANFSLAWLPKQQRLTNSQEHAVLASDYPELYAAVIATLTNREEYIAAGLLSRTCKEPKPKAPTLESEYPEFCEPPRKKIKKEVKETPNGRKLRLWEGKPPADGRFKLVGLIPFKDDVCELDWKLYVHDAGPWINFKLVAREPCPFKANYFGSYNTASRTLSSLRDTLVMQEGRPQLYEDLTNFFQKTVLH